MADGDHSLSSALDGAVDGGGGGCSTAAPSAFLSIPAPEIKAIDEGVRKVTSSLQASPSNAGGAGSSHIITLIPALICSGPDLRFPPGGRPEWVPRRCRSTAIAMTRAGRAVVGGHSPQAMTLPPRRLRAALHPLRHPLEPRCARLEPRPALLNMRASVAYSLPRPNSAHAYHFALHARICAHTDIAPCSGSKRARAAVGVPGSESDVAIRATFLRRRATPAFRMLPHATTPRTFLRPTPARACMCSQPMLIWQEQGSHWRWRKLDKLGETHRSRSTRGRAATAAVG